MISFAQVNVKMTMRVSNGMLDSTTPSSLPSHAASLQALLSLGSFRPRTIANTKAYSWNQRLIQVEE